ncbi:hypothetical protein HDF10_003046 [Edaphobacter lichenicola]|uniref:Uncharacterized protein n=1 Tax=Tunturiibacter lichenicola TaxID=2051959 RepID=A0A7W8J9B7_9BACT|nr:hypothetical protein [Edaphobacter lichenicola]
MKLVLFAEESTNATSSHNLEVLSCIRQRAERDFIMSLSISGAGFWCKNLNFLYRSHN